MTDTGNHRHHHHHHQFPATFDGAPLDELKRQRLADALAIFDVMLKGRTWSAADHFTVADLTLLVTVAQLEGFGFDLGPYKRVQGWLIRCKNKLEPFGYDVSTRWCRSECSDVIESGFIFSLTHLTPAGNRTERRGYVGGNVACEYG